MCVDEQSLARLLQLECWRTLLPPPPHPQQPYLQAPLAPLAPLLLPARRCPMQCGNSRRCRAACRSPYSSLAASSAVSYAPITISSACR
jgi:hypothetical protein